MSTDTHHVTLPGRPVEANLSVAEIIAYLQEKFWAEANSDRTYRRFWKDDDHVARLPRETHPDTVRCIREAVCDIAKAEWRHPLDVLADLLAARGGA
jgi:N-acyl-D-aspartate/D-glutamate deacylase